MTVAGLARYSRPPASGLRNAPCEGGEPAQPQSEVAEKRTHGLVSSNCLSAFCLVGLPLLLVVWLGRTGFCLGFFFCFFLTVPVGVCRLPASSGPGLGCMRLKTKHQRIHFRVIPWVLKSPACLPSLHHSESCIFLL